MSEGYSSPDIIITPNGNDGEALIAEVISPFVGLLQINPLFRQALAEASSEQVDQWQEDLERADLLVKCLQQRTNTMVRLTRRILALQRDFILHGDKCLQPMTRARLANELRVNESTISRAVAGKTVQLPSGHIIPLSKFFDRSLHIRVILTQIIACETSPLSDSDLASRLKEHGFHVARRTVAKYRTMEGILPSHLRGNRSKIPPSHRER
jgi:RNA polymerase sigma-54 factor